MKAELSGYPLKAFAICLIAYATAQMDLALFGYAIPSIRAEFGLSLSGVMAIVSSAFVIGGVLIVWLGLLTDRLGRKRSPCRHSGSSHPFFAQLRVSPTHTSASDGIQLGPLTCPLRRSERAATS